MNYMCRVVALTILACASSALAAPSGVAPDYVPQTLSTTQAQADVALARRALELIHPGLYRYSGRATMDAAFDRLAKVATQSPTELDLWRELAVTLAMIHCDHTKPEPPDRLTAFREAQPTHLPFRFQLLEGRMIVVSNDGQVGAPPAGAEILSINDRPVARILNTLAPSVSFDGTTEQAISAKLSEDSDLMGDDVDEYWPAYFGFAKTWALRWAIPGTTESTMVSLSPITFTRWKDLPWGGARFRSEFYNGIGWRMAGTAAYLRIDTLVNYRNPVDATAFLGGFFRSMKSAGTQRLILDLRHNSGGSEDVSVALGRWLMPAPFVWSKPVWLKAVRYGDLPQYIQSWGDRTALFEPPLTDFTRRQDGWWERIPDAQREDDESTLLQTPSDDRFTGQLLILSGPRNASGATRTIAQLKDKRDASVIGEATSGSAEGPTAGHIFLLTLPHSGVKVRIPNAWNRTNVSRFDAGQGVAADRVVIETLADNAAGFDQVLDVAKARNPKPAPALVAVLSGNWSGTVDRRDVRSDERVSKAARLTATQSKDQSLLAFDIDDARSRTVSGQDTWTLSRDHQWLTVNRERLHVAEYLGGPNDGDLTLVAERKGIDVDRAATVRVVLVRRGVRLDISRLTRRAGEPFLLLTSYRLHRES